MAPLPLSESAEVVLDADGNGTASLGPYGPNEMWTPSNVSVICSSNANEATCKVYAGPSPSPAYFKDITVDGSTGDATDRCNIPIPKGWYVWAVWTGGDPGATATLNVDGTKTGA
jgi:hypothetical protein